MDAEEIAALFTPEMFTRLRGDVPRHALITPDGEITFKTEKIQEYCLP